MIMMNIYKCGLERLKFSARCGYNDNKPVGECLRYMQCKVITFVMVTQRFVIAIMTDID